MKDENVAAMLGVFLFKFLNEKDNFKYITGNELKLYLYLVWNAQFYHFS